MGDKVKNPFRFNLSVHRRQPDIMGDKYDFLKLMIPTVPRRQPDIMGDKYIVIVKTKW